MRAALVVLALCACGGPPSSVATDSRIADLSRTFDLGPGDFAEANLVLPAGGTVRATFDAASVAVAWNVHSHPGDQVVMHDQGTAATRIIEFTAPAAGPFSLMWENTAGAATTLSVTLELPDGAEVDSWHP